MAGAAVLLQRQFSGLLVEAVTLLLVGIHGALVWSASFDGRLPALAPWGGGLVLAVVWGLSSFLTGGEVSEAVLWLLLVSLALPLFRRALHRLRIRERLGRAKRVAP